MEQKNKIELLAPAGDFEKLKVAIAYGADAVYMAGQRMGLRANAKNFNTDELREAIEYAHARGKKIFITTNIIAHNEDHEGLEDYFKKLEEYGADALIIADLGVFSIAKSVVPNMEIHVSTQANITSYQTALMWKALGASRVNLARELGKMEMQEIRNETKGKIELEVFCHGAMCISYSGRCLLSSFMNDRDSNRGDCSHPCRWKYNVVEEKRPGEYMPVFEDEQGTHIFNSKDLCLIEHIPELIMLGIDSLKIEGRMKTPYYVASAVSTYRRAIDDYYESPEIYYKNLPIYLEELSKASHREYTKGFFLGKTDATSQIYSNNLHIRGYDFCAIVLEYNESEKYCIVQQRNKFVLGDEVEFLHKDGSISPFKVGKFYNEKCEKITEAPHPKQIIKLDLSDFCGNVSELEIMRKKVLKDS